MPNIAAALENTRKLAFANPSEAIVTAVAADSDAIAKPRPLPMRRMINVAGTVVTAVATTISDTGNVAHARLLANVAPIIPPSVTNMIAPVADISWQTTRIARLLFCIGEPGGT
jgi:hypothetical protein